MMFGELEALGRRAVSCKHWRWMPGMLTTQNFRLVEIDPTLIVCDGRSMMHFRTRICLTWLDLSDPATLGCLLYLVRAGTGDRLADVVSTNRYHAFNDESSDCCAPAWIVKYRNGQQYCQAAGPTEAEALVAALEGAP